MQQEPKGRPGRSAGGWIVIHGIIAAAMLLAAPLHAEPPREPPIPPDLNAQPPDPPDDEADEADDEGEPDDDEGDDLVEIVHRTADGRPMEEHRFELLPADWPDPDPATYPEVRGFARLEPGWIELRRAGVPAPVRVRLYEPSGVMNSAAVRKIEELLSDKKHKRRRRFKPRTLAMLYVIAQHYQRPIEVVSGFRVPERPARGKKGSAKGKKGKKGKKGYRRGKGSVSHHALGEAVDLKLSGVPAEHLAHWLKGRFVAVGVGFYPTSGFVHVDARTRTSHWIDFSGPGEAQRYQKLPVERIAPPGSDWTAARGARPPEELRPPRPASKPKPAGRAQRRGKATSSARAPRR